MRRSGVRSSSAPPYLSVVYSELSSVSRSVFAPRTGPPSYPHPDGVVNNVLHADSSSKTGSSKWGCLRICIGNQSVSAVSRVHAGRESSYPKRLGSSTVNRPNRCRKACCHSCGRLLEVWGAYASACGLRLPIRFHNGRAKRTDSEPWFHKT